MLHDSPISPRAGRLNLLLALAIFFGISFVLFAVLSIVAFNKAHVATTTLYTEKQAAAKSAAKAQASTDKEAYQKENESPYQTYTAPNSYGDFVVRYPKNWSNYDQENLSDNNQVNLALNPSSVGVTNEVNDPIATQIILQQKEKDAALLPLASAIKKGAVKEKDIIVSGITGTDVTGTFPDKRTIRAVYIPVRDKTLIITTERSDYMNEYNQILSLMKINP